MTKKEIRDTNEKLKKNNARLKLDSEGNPKVSAKLKSNPTRYGDWEKGGRCIDF